MWRAMIAAALLLAAPAGAEEIGRVGVDWTGNDVVVESFQDPKVPGVTCHVAYFSRSVLDRLSQGNWFEDPSNSAITCSATRPVTLGDIKRGPKGEDVFSEGRSLIWKSLRVRRIYDEQHNVLVYLAHARQVQQGSAKMAISSVPVAPVALPVPAGR